jgi:hypothetical protein
MAIAFDLLLLVAQRRLAPWREATVEGEPRGMRFASFFRGLAGQS